MSQVVLGLRSLTIKLAIFFVMAALLAWALGGTLFPKPFIANLEDQGVALGSTHYYWQLSIEDRKDATPEWRFMKKDGTDVVAMQKTPWKDMAGPVLAIGNVYFAGRNDLGWTLTQIDAQGAVLPHPMPDRLAVEQQLERVKSGLPLQDSLTIQAERSAVLDPHDPIADLPGAGSAAPGGSD